VAAPDPTPAPSEPSWASPSPAAPTPAPSWGHSSDQSSPSSSHGDDEQ
jgi:hypothetical protein